MTASALAAKRWGVVTTTAAMFDVVVYHSARYIERCRCNTPEEAFAYAMRATAGRRRAVADVWSPHLGVTSVVSGHRTDLYNGRTVA